MSSVSVCPIEEVAPKIQRPMWFQLYVLKDRGFMQNALERAQAAGLHHAWCSRWTCPCPAPATATRIPGMSGPNAPLRRYWQAATHPRWAVDVGLLGRPHDLGNISAYRAAPQAWRTTWVSWAPTSTHPFLERPGMDSRLLEGPHGHQGHPRPEDAKDAVRFGADGIIVSNHGGRQLDGVLSSARALPAIADAVKGQIKILADSGIRNGLDVVRALALGADCAMIGRAYIYALAAAGEAGVKHLLELLEKNARGHDADQRGPVADISGRSAGARSMSTARKSATRLCWRNCATPWAPPMSHRRPGHAALSQGHRTGEGPVLAVVRPGTLLEQWKVLQAAVAAGRIVIMQAANTGLTGGSTPTVPTTTARSCW